MTGTSDGIKELLMDLVAAFHESGHTFDVLHVSEEGNQRTIKIVVRNPVQRDLKVIKGGIN